MRLERDAIGETEIPDEALYSLGTLRLMEAVPSVGPRFPVEFALEILRTRKRQVLDWGARGAWEAQHVDAFCRVADKLVATPELLTSQVRVRPLQEPTGRSLVANVDELATNLVLSELGARLGEYFRFPFLLQLNVGVRCAEVFASAARAATDKSVEALLLTIDGLLERLSERIESAGHEPLLIKLQSHTVAMYPADTCWITVEADIHRTRDALAKLRDEFPVSRTGVHSNEICEADYFHRLGNEISGLLSRLVQLSNYCKMLLDCFGESKWPRLRSVDPLNPGYDEPVYADFIVQTCLCAQSKLWMISQFRGQSTGDLDAFTPIISVELYEATSLASALCRLISTQWFPRLPQFQELQLEQAANSPLQAERLISMIGFERAVQVARMSSLTGKPVRSVVEKMKVLTPEQLLLLFPTGDTGNKKGES